MALHTLYFFFFTFLSDFFQSKMLIGLLLYFLIKNKTKPQEDIRISNEPLSGRPAFHNSILLLPKEKKSLQACFQRHSSCTKTPHQLLQETGNYYAHHFSSSLARWSNHSNPSPSPIRQASPCVFLRPATALRKTPD